MINQIVDNVINMREIYIYSLIILTGVIFSSCGSKKEVINTSSEESVNEVTQDQKCEVEFQDESVSDFLDKSIELEVLASGFEIAEGPVWVPSKKMFLFSDVKGNKIHSWTQDEGLNVFLSPSGHTGSVPFFEGCVLGSNGLTLDSDGQLIICQHGDRRLAKLSLDNVSQEGLSTLVDKFEGKRFNSPNDLTVAANGDIYFTDPPYGMAELENDPAREIDYNGIYRLSPEGEIQLLERNQTRPNGLVFSPDEETLYVANSDAENKVWYAYTVIHGIIGNPRIFYDVNDQSGEGAADGMKVDIEGNIFATGPGGVWVFDPDGTHLGTIKPSEVPANVAWGDDGSTLYMTARTGLYRVRLSTSGEIP